MTDTRKGGDWGTVNFRSGGQSLVRSETGMKSACLSLFFAQFRASARDPSLCRLRHGTTYYRPCETRYHAQCIRAGPPFRNRFGADSSRLTYPCWLAPAGFVCEACTVWAHLGRELDGSHQDDLYLLQLERVRLIDTAWNWASLLYHPILILIGRAGVGGYNPPNKAHLSRSRTLA